MKIIPDPAYVWIQCSCTRVGDGTKAIIPFVASKIPDDKVKGRFSTLAATGIVLSPIIVSFFQSEAMYAALFGWLTSSWFLGACRNCDHRAEGGTTT